MVKRGGFESCGPVVLRVPAAAGSVVVTVTGGVGEDEVTSKGEEDEGKRVLVEVMNTVVWAGVAGSVSV